MKTAGLPIVMLILLLVHLNLGIAVSAVIHVPGDQPTIQAGIDAAAVGDTVLVADGTYTGTGNRDLDFAGKNISVQSENGAVTCIIDCLGSEEENHRGFYFHTGETNQAVVDGFTICNGVCTGGSTSNSFGGGILCAGAVAPVIVNCIITRNVAPRFWGIGGGIGCIETAAPTICNCTISENLSYLSGGGIACLDSAAPTIADCSISGNSTWSAGGGVLAGIGTNPMIANCTILENTAFDYGSGIACGENASTIIANCKISRNAASYGGGVACERGSATLITNCSITSNTCIDPSSGGGQGGGIYNVGYESELIIITSFISGNEAGEAGGGLYLESANAYIADSVISDNTGGGGGGIFCDSDAFCSIANTLLSGNTANGGDPHSPLGGGAILCTAQPHLSLANCTITGNASSLPHGGGIYCGYYTLLSIDNSIMWGDESPEIDGYPIAEVTYSDIEGGYPGEGNINADPLFATGPFGSYYLSNVAAGQAADSPCRNAGSVLAAGRCYVLPGSAACMSVLTTSTDAMSDAGVLDVGYHYPTGIGVELSMPAHVFYPGDECRLAAETHSSQPATVYNVPLAVALDLGVGVYWLYPHWRPYPPNFDYEVITLYPGVSECVIIASFTWPAAGGDSYDQAHFYAAMLTKDLSAIYGSMGRWDFGWGP